MVDMSWWGPVMDDHPKLLTIGLSLAETIVNALLKAVSLGFLTF